MEAENYMDNFKVIKWGRSRVVCDQVEGQSNVVSGRQVLKHTKPGLEVRLDEELVGLSLQDKCTPSWRRRSKSPPHETTAPVSPRLSPNSNTQVSIRTWKRLAREFDNPTPNYTLMIVDRRPSIETIDLREGKKVCLIDCSSLDKEILKVVAGSQHHCDQWVALAETVVGLGTHRQKMN